MSNGSHKIKDVLHYSESIKNGIAKKAESNKRTSDLLYKFVITLPPISTLLLLIPIESVWLNKFIPAVLMVGASISSSWLQLRKPHERWLLYRTAQREMEYEIDQYKLELNEYTKSNDKDKVLGDKITKRALELHYQWEPMIPKLEDLDKVKNKN